MVFFLLVEAIGVLLLELRIERTNNLRERKDPRQASKHRQASWPMRSGALDHDGAN